MPSCSRSPAGPMPEPQQNRGRIQRAGGEHHLVGADLVIDAVLPVADADGAPVLDDHGMDVAPGADVDADAHRLEVGGPGVAAATLLHRHLLLRDAVEVIAVVIRIVLQPLLDGRSDDGGLDRAQRVVIRHRERAAGAAQIGPAAREVLDRAVHREHIISSSTRRHRASARMWS